MAKNRSRIKENEPVGIKNIAQALKVSIGTVDRALHNRPGVSDSTKHRVLQMAGELGYKPNLAAQALKLNRRLSIAAVLPREISHFFGPLRNGITAAAGAPVSTRISLTFHEFPRLGAGEAEAFDHATASHCDGLIVVPGNMRKLETAFRKLAHAGTAIMCVGNDAPNTERVGSVTAHASVSGAMAAEVLALKLSHKASVAIFSGELSMLDHAEKLRGFAATLAVQAPHLSLMPALESHERPEDAYRQARRLMKQRNRPDGLYLSTANSMPVLEALDELNLLGEVQIITTDLYQELTPLLESGKVLATLHQRPHTQGKLAFENLLQYLLRGEGESTPNHVRLAPHIVFRSNLSLFSTGLPEREDELKATARSAPEHGGVVG